VARVVQLGGMVTVASLGGFMFLMFRRDKDLSRKLGKVPNWHDDENTRNG